MAYDKFLPFVFGVHALVDLVDASEGDFCEVLKGQHVEGGRDRPLTSGLGEGIQFGHGHVLTELDVNVDPVLVEVVQVVTVAELHLW